ncbi:MCE family protein [Actinacidiphila bryophytorum]|uniref:Phospholipid/cholesterol/gamma-HCH transport system substrate-binding protein n=1 Tax=Actinacidiphila bryophytorum TaxID=1436133 RepID=A0A9W4GZR6_9ACTN|nr:MCE family protein [Actinacidiphila bryophytorum]MBM9434857.1 MCE family protein [Actinacidiphila bryophytorum]MBN6544351.1 MCE family protein [Actinacidiphila bryophytorum]CAG7630900.1 Phospholipid/cholesterol/gamma-HCH transport system substrate-binding protein [Actinacidiphila bryophytorum]
MNRRRTNTVNRRRTKRSTAVAAAGALLGLTLGGCSFGGVQSLPLPGGADLGSHPYTVKAQFADVLDLVPQASVRVNDVAVGRVTSIHVADDGWSALVTMKVNGKVRLPANAYAHLEQSSLLGEKYVQLSAPPAGETARGKLAGGSVIPTSHTNRNPEVEEVFGALSLLLNGGGIQQLKTISTELNKALTGNEPEVRDMLTQVDTLVTDLDTHKQDITDALDGVNQLSATLAVRDQKIGTVLTGLSPGLKVLDQQRGSLVTMLRALDTLSGVAVDTVNQSKDDMVADIQALAPTLQRLADSGKDLPDSLQVLLTYPFTDEVLNGVKGDYLNVYLDLTAAPGTRLIPTLKSQDNTYDQGAQPLSKKNTIPKGLPLPLPTVTTTAGGR